MGISDFIQTLSFIAKVARWVPQGKRSLVAVRRHVTLTVIRQLHCAVVHRARKLAVAVQDLEGGEKAASHLGLQICTETRKLLSKYLELGDNELHACIKFLSAPEDGEEGWKVSTWVRSEPSDDRPPEIEDGYSHLVSKNTVWAALLGESDGQKNWRPFSVFGCNDLTNYTDFECDRDNWQRYYRSTLVFPIKYVVDNMQQPQVLGFLAFDSPKKNAFPGIPDILDNTKSYDPATYREHLEQRSVFHLGAIVADILGAVLRHAVQQTDSPENPNGREQ